MNFSLIVSDTDTGSPPLPHFNHQPQRHAGGYSAQPRSSPAPTTTNEFTTLVGGPPLPRPSLFQPPTSCYDSLVVRWPQPRFSWPRSSLPLHNHHQRVVKTCWWLFPVLPLPALPPPASRYDLLVVCSPQPPSSRPRLSLPLHNHHQ